MKKIIITAIILLAISLALYYFLFKKEQPVEAIPEDQSTVIQNPVKPTVPTQVEQPKPEAYVCNNIVEIEWFPGRQNDAIEIGKALSDKLNCTVRVLPAWNRRIGPEEPRGDDIRYFWAQDEKGARAVADFVNNSFSDQLTVYAPYPEKLTDNSGGWKRSPQGYLELWLKKK